MINVMDNQRERITVVESDPQTSDMIANQTLRPLGYLVDVLESASTALKEIDQLTPDLIITNLHLPGISGKDLLIALTARGINAPIIVVTPKGGESDALQAFRLGAANFITFPLREAEIVNVVEDTLNQFRKQNELEVRARQLDQIKEEMEQRSRDLVEIFSIGKLVPSAGNQSSLYERIVSIASQVTKSDGAWMLVFDQEQKKYILRACLNVDGFTQSDMDQPYDNSLSYLVAVSGQAVSVQGEALKGITLPGIVESILVAPVKWKDDVVGMIAVMRKEAHPFNNDQQGMLEIIAEYAALLIENSRRYQVLEQRLVHQQQANIYTSIDSDLKNDLLLQASHELRSPLLSLMKNLDGLANLRDRRLNQKQTNALNAIQEDAGVLTDVIDAMENMHAKAHVRILEQVNLNDLVCEVVNRSHAIAQVSRITIKVEMPVLPTLVTVFSAQITKVIEGLLSNALKYSLPKSQITIRVERKNERTLVVIKDEGIGVNENLVDKLFTKKINLGSKEASRFGGIGISLPMIKEIISAHRGEIWVESSYGKGFTIGFSIPQ
ncbi:MAG: hypothetical protein A2136_11480 [Chloroflexi bacterium RBG_16_54_11]|nr:MAG: hypothetical protein A2136_11480 [Chloroflexi bacterium RBG_16_54_11]